MGLVACLPGAVVLVAARLREPVLAGLEGAARG
jgi:hypothetical protein